MNSLCNDNIQSITLDIDILYMQVLAVICKFYEFIFIFFKAQKRPEVTHVVDMMVKNTTDITERGVVNFRNNRCYAYIKMI